MLFLSWFFARRLRVRSARGLAGFWRLGFAGCPCARMRLRYKQHTCPAIQMHVLPCGSNQRTFRAVRSGGTQIEPMQTENTLAARGKLSGGVQAANRAA